MTAKDASIEENKSDKPTKKRWWKRILKAFGWLILIVLILIIALILAIRSQWGQDIIVKKATQYVSNKTHTPVDIKKLFVTFDGGIRLEGLYLEDKQGDTLMYSKSLQAAIPLWPIIKGEPVSINRLKWDGLRANVNRLDSIENFNYQFLIDAFTKKEEDESALKTTQEEEQSEPIKIAVGKVDLKDFKVNYVDSVTGLGAHLNLGHLKFRGRELNLEKMLFDVREITLSDTKIDYIQTKPFPESADSSAAVLPFVKVDLLKLDNVEASYVSLPDDMDAKILLDEFYVKVPKADLAGQDIEVNKLSLSNSDIKLKINKKDEPEIKVEKVATTDKTNEEFVLVWPEWEVKVKHIDLNKNQILYQVGEKPKTLKQFNADYIDLKDFTFQLSDLALSKEEILQANLKKFSFEEASGLHLKALNFDLKLDSTKLSLNDFKLETNKSQLQANLSSKYEKLEDLINLEPKTTFDLNIDKADVLLAEIYQFAPNLRSNTYFAELAKRKLNLKAKANGNLKSLDIKQLIVNWSGTHINTRGKLSNLTDVDHLRMNIPNLKLNSTRNDILKFVDEKDIGIKIPETVDLQGNLVGQLNNLKSVARLKIPEGEIVIDGAFANQNDIAFNADVEVIDFDLGKLLDNPEIGKVELKLVTEGKGSSPEKITAQLETDFSKLEYNGYDFSALKINGELNEGAGNLIASYTDDNLDFTFDNQIKLDSLSQNVSSILEVRKADLSELNLLDKDMLADLYLMTDFQNNDGAMALEAHLIDGNIYYNRKTYLVGPLNLIGGIEQDSTSFAVDSRIFSGQMAINSDPKKFGKALERQFKRYYKDSVSSIDTLTKPVRMEADFKVKPHPLLTEVFVPSITELDTVNIAAHFDQAKNDFNADLQVNYLDVLGNTIDDFYAGVNSTEEAGEFVVGFEKFDAGSFGMYRTFFNGDLSDGDLTINFFSFDKDDNIFYRAHSITSGKQGEIKFHLLPYNFILNNETWDIPEDNEIVIRKKGIEAHNFRLEHEGRVVRVANDLLETRRKVENIGVSFKDFKLRSILALFNSDEKLATGLLQGKLVAVNPMSKIGFLADFGIDDLSVYEAPLGNLSLKAFSRELNIYRFSFDLKGDDVDFTSGGKFDNTNKPSLDANFDLKRFGFNTIAQLSQKELTEGTGYLTGKLTINGQLEDPHYSGFLKFKEASFRVSQLNTKFSLNEDEIKVNEKGLEFVNFNIQDENNHPFSIKGTIGTKKLTNPKFNLQLNTTDFQLMNSKEEHSDAFYGKAIFGLNGTIKGSLMAPDVDVNININKETDFTYVMSASQASIESREGVVEFVDKTKPIYVIENEEDKKTNAPISGLSLKAKINIEKQAEIAVIIDPRTQDNLHVSGAADLDFRMSRNGQMTLTGNYTVDKGYYKMSLYNLVSRKFDFQPGSTITWAGDPMDADLDFTATYLVKTSASGLMAGSGQTEEEANKYKQRLPFIVSLNVDGTIDRPELSFGLSMEEESKGALNGTVYSKLNQLQNDEGELNKQVFSLLVLNRFFPDPGSDGGGGGVASMARDNITQALSDQLNLFSDQLTGDSGFKLNFGLDSYDTYSGSSSQQRTDLDITAEQRLLNDRLVIKVGTEMNLQGDLQPGEERPVLGNASLEYLLTEDGRWRIRGFRKNEYENVIDGQVFTNGIGLLFQKDFSSFQYLFRSFFGNPEKYYEKKRKEREAKKEQEKREAQQNRNKETTDETAPTNHKNEDE